MERLSILSRRAAVHLMQRTGCAVLALDVSATKIGVAVSDPSRIRGLPLFTLRRDRLDASGAATRAPRRPRIRAPALTRILSSGGLPLLRQLRV